MAPAPSARPPAAPAAPGAGHPPAADGLARVGWQDGLRYGALAAPLAFAALPMVVHLPAHYAATLGAPLAGLGAVMLAVRIADAVSDPLIGRLTDHLLGAPRAALRRWAVLGAMLLAGGMWALYFPLADLRQDTAALLGWCAAALLITSLGYSGLSVLHQAWGTRLGGGAPVQARLAGWREGLALGGVVLASVLPAVGGMAALVAAAAAGLVIGLPALSHAPAPPRHADPTAATAVGSGAQPAGSWRLPWQQPAFRRLLAVYLLNGMASAVPATLVTFYVRDRLGAPGAEAGLLALYFVSAALAVPWWTRAVDRWGLVATWTAGMLLAIAAFVGAAGLGRGDLAAFALVCAASGAALGADLVAPPALLAGVVQRAGHARCHEGLYAGWWTCTGKLSLAAAAGVALPLLQALGYRPGAVSPEALQSLAITYAALPCLIKTAAAALLWRHRRLLETKA